LQSILLQAPPQQLAHPRQRGRQRAPVRLAAKETVALAKFYQSAFGMQEVNRIENKGGTEVFVNFGATVEAAKANKNPRMILFHRDSDDVKDPTTHVIFSVKDMAATGAAIRAAGGTMTRDKGGRLSAGFRIVVF
jgi:predicted enzyme related to lactoylglutathione lyase